MLSADATLVVAPGFTVQFIVESLLHTNYANIDNREILF